jgi:hypothetical protein
MVRFQVGDSSQEYLRWSVQGTHECESAFCHCFSVIVLSNSPGRAFWLADNHIAKSNVGCFTGYSASDTHQQAKPYRLESRQHLSRHRSCGGQAMHAGREAGENDIMLGNTTQAVGV